MAGGLTVAPALAAVVRIATLMDVGTWCPVEVQLHSCGGCGVRSRPGEGLDVTAARDARFAVGCAAWRWAS